MMTRKVMSNVHLFKPLSYFLDTELFQWLQHLTEITGGLAAFFSLVVSFICLEIAIVFIAFYLRTGRRLDLLLGAQSLFGCVLNLVSWAIFSNDTEIHNLLKAVPLTSPKAKQTLQASAFWIRMQYATAFLMMMPTLRFLREAVQWQPPRRLFHVVYACSLLCALFCFSTLFFLSEPKLQPFYALNERKLIQLPSEPEGSLYYPMVIILFGSIYLLLYGILRAVPRNSKRGAGSVTYARRRKAIAIGLFIVCGLAMVDVVFAVNLWTLTSFPHLYTIGWGVFCILSASALFKEMVHEEIAKRELRRRVRQAQEQTEQSIAGGMAHEIKNALGGPVLVLGDTIARALGTHSQEALMDVAQSLERHRPSLGDDFLQVAQQLESVQDALRDLQDAILLSLTDVQRGIAVTDIVLDLAKVDNRATHEPVNLNVIVEQTMNHYVRSYSDVAFHFDPAGKVQACGNPHLFRSVVQNLLSNAVDAVKAKSDGGGKVVRARIVAEEQEGRRYCLLEVQDNGTGIKEEYLDRIFDPFFSTKGSRGTGLGLNLVKRIVELYEGEIEVQSEEGVGSTFRVHLPESHACDLERASTAALSPTISKGG
jgi:signal transduction histidine kinase